MYNKATIIGRIGKDPETRYTGGGVAVTNFSVATTETWKDRNGEKKEKTEWHRITVWGKLAEIVQKYGKKGMLVLVEGRIETRSWEDRDHVKRYSTGIVADTFRMLGSKSGNAGGSAPAGEPNTHTSESTEDDFNKPSGESVSGPGSEITDDDIPF